MKRLISIILTIGLLVGVAATLASCGGTAIKIDPNKEEYTVGIIQLAPHDALDAATQGFRDALTAALEAKGRRVTFLYQNAQGDVPTCNTIANSFVSSGVDLIMGNATAALQSAYSATQNIPILGTSITEYGVALGLSDFNGVVGSNVSGTSDLAPLEEQARMMIDTLNLSEGNRVALVYCSAEPNSVYQVNKMTEYLSAEGIVCTSYKFADSNEMQAVAEKAAGENDAIYVPTDNTVASYTSIIDNVCAPKKIPVFAGEEATCLGCGYATLAISYYNIGLKTGEMAAKVLLGEIDITEMAIEYDAEPVKKYNRRSCENLGIDIDALEAKGYVAIEE